jgi:hypothetical protein
VLASAVWIVFTSSLYARDPVSSAKAQDAKLPAAESELKRRLQEEVPKAWAELAEYYATMRLTRRLTIKPQNAASKYAQSFDRLHRWNDEEKKRKLSSFKTADPRIELVVNRENVKQLVATRSYETVMAKNDQYGFAIRRPIESPPARYTVVEVDRLGSDPKTDAFVADEVRRVKKILFAAWTHDGKSLTEWTATPPFTVSRISAVGSGNQSRVRVEFEKMRLVPRNLRSGFIVFDPRDHWVIHEFQTNASDGSSYNNKMEYGDHKNGIPILTKIDFLLKDKSGDVFEDAVANIECRHDTAPPEEFRLSYYGLPEPKYSKSTKP